MDLDELKQAWAAHGALLQRSVAVNERLLRELFLRKVRFALAPYALMRALEVALGAAVAIATIRVLAAHAAEARYLVLAGGLAGFSAWMTALCAWLLVKSLRLDPAAPVTALQRDLERLLLVEYRAFKWALLGGTALWLPAPLVLFEAATGFDALARVDLGWLAANVALGLVLLAVGLALSRRYLERSDLGPRARRIVEALSGYGLRKAAAQLQELAQFEREEGPRG